MGEVTLLESARALLDDAETGSNYGLPDDLLVVKREQADHLEQDLDALESLPARLREATGGYAVIRFCSWAYASGNDETWWDINLENGPMPNFSSFPKMVEWAEELIREKILFRRF